MVCEMEPTPDGERLRMRLTNNIVFRVVQSSTALKNSH